MKHFYNTADFSQEEIMQMIILGIQMKHGNKGKSLAGKFLAALFFNPSLRTRVSFVMAMEKLGGITIPVDSKENAYPFAYEEKSVMNTGAIEHVKEAARVLSRYCNAIAIRASALITTTAESAEVSDWNILKQDTVLKQFMRYATVPVINMESNVYHPCQGLADALTIREKLGETKGKKYVLTWTYHPKALPMATPNSQILASCDLGMDIVIAHPKGWELDPEILSVMEMRARQAGGSITVENSMTEACVNAHIVCAKSWGALAYYGNWKKEKAEREELKDWIVDEKKMAKTDNGFFMHCLPVRRNVEVTDGVIDGKNSLVIDQAENRLWAQMAILEKVIL